MLKNTLLSVGTALTLLAGSANAQDWSGFYLGGFAESGASTMSITPVSYQSTDVSFGIFAGYNFTTGSNIVYGIEAEYDAADYSTNITFPYGVKSAFGLRGRVGFTMGSAMVYGLLGVQSANIGLNVTSVLDEQVTGISAGAGIEYFISDGLSVRGEFVYTDYGDNYTYLPGFNTSTQSMRLGAAYHF